MAVGVVVDVLGATEGGFEGAATLSAGKEGLGRGLMGIHDMRPALEADILC